MSYSEEYLVIINTWHEAAVTGRFSNVDYFSKFMFEYFAFIAYLVTQLYPRENDGHAVTLLKENPIKEDYLRLVSTDDDLCKDWIIIKKELDSSPLTKSSLRDSSEIDNGITINDLSDWDSMVEFWRCIRNNLFHGAKDINVDRDQFLVEYGYKTLSKFVELLIRL